MSTYAVTAVEYSKHQEQFAKQGGQLPTAGAERLSLQLQCKLVGDGPEGWACFASKLKERCSDHDHDVQHLGDLHASELAVTAHAVPVMATRGVSELA